MRAAFIGHFSPPLVTNDTAVSVAGNQVQLQIFRELSEKCGAKNTICYSMTPQSFWPNGPLVSHTSKLCAIEFIGYINLPVLKHIIFSVRLLLRLLSSRPNLCLQYNSYLFENIALLLFRTFKRKSSLAIIIQDVNIFDRKSIQLKRVFRSFSEKLSLRLATHFNIIIPVSSEIMTDFRFAPSKCFVFQGGITEFACEIMRKPEQDLVAMGVFAGGLEPHNGIDRLVDQWRVSGIKQPLHVFGRGSLASYISQVAAASDNVFFHGFQSEEVVMDWQLKARWNFCLRYSLGLNQTYFFPSKLFNILCARGTVIVNDFHGLPNSLENYLCIVKDDLSDLADQLSSTVNLSDSDCVRTRREIVRSQHSWSSCMDRVIKKCAAN